MATRLAVLLVSLFMVLSLPLRAENALTNQDVVKMVSAGLGEETVIAKVHEAPRTDFRLEVDDLVALRQAGVSERVVQAMLERNRPTAPRPEAAIAQAMGMDLVEVSLKQGREAVPLQMSRGDMSAAGFMGMGNAFVNFPGLRARVRTAERRPVLLVKCPSSPEGGRYFLGKLDRDRRNSVRSLKISSTKQGLKAMFGSNRGVQSPDPDWTVPFEVAEESAGLWRITPKEDLEPGEYGWYIDLIAGPQSGGIFDFGVD